MPKTSEHTQIAVINLQLTQIQKDITNITTDIKEIKNNRYATTNEVSMQIKDMSDKFTKALSDHIEDCTNNINEHSRQYFDELSQFKRILIAVNGAILLAVLGAIMKLILKV